MFKRFWGYLSHSGLLLASVVAVSLYDIYRIINPEFLLPGIRGLGATVVTLALVIRLMELEARLSVSLGQHGRIFERLEAVENSSKKD